jgi:DNA-binding response OmpR family regulator
MVTKKVMLIEDDSTMITLLSKLLQFEGFNVAPLKNDENLDTILECVRKEKPEIILLDVYLRDISGFDLLKRLRTNPQTKHIRILMSSGMDLEEKCMNEGADNFIMKPYMPEDLLSSIWQTLEETNNKTESE